nr:hypothetical protein BaRGS_001615 [Batillaria attramentaria]
MFSAYVDKLWAPNLEFWRVLGRNVKLAMRPNSSKSLECGHDVTFPEVIRYVIKGLEEGACDYDYDYIGHLETFREDAGYILNAINITTTRGLSFDNDTLRDYVVQAYYTFLIGKRT